MDLYGLTTLAAVLALGCVALGTWLKQLLTDPRKHRPRTDLHDWHPMLHTTARSPKDSK